MLSKYDEVRARRARGDKGFTLIELLVVVVIIGILIAIAIPVYLNYQKGSHDKAAESDVRGAITAMEQCFSETGTYATGGPSDGSGADITFANCSTHVKTSPGTVLEIKQGSGGAGTYAITSYNKDGSGAAKTFTYDSTNGGSVGTSSVAAPTT